MDEGMTRPSMSSSNSSSVSTLETEAEEVDEGEAFAKPRVEYASDDWEDVVWSLSSHSRDCLEPR